MCQCSDFDNSAEVTQMLSSSMFESDVKFEVNGLTKHTMFTMDVVVKRDSANVFPKTGVSLFLGGNEVLFSYSRTLQSISLLKNET